MKIALVCSHGGHLTETLQILGAFEDQDIFFITYHSPRNEEVEAIAPAYFTDNIGTNPWRMLKAVFWSAAILRRERPDVLFSLGAEIALPFFYLGKMMGVKTIFVESWCRVENLSKSGQLIYPIADEFWIQWPQLTQFCGPKAKYRGAVI